MSDSQELQVTAATDMTVAQVRQLLDAIPDATDDPTPRMVAAIMAAEDPLDWVKTFEATSIKKRVDGRYRFTALRKAPSQFKGSLEDYLIAEVVNLDTGEADVMPISSLMSIVQLVVANERGWLPLDAIVRQKKTPTRQGFYPIHLEALPPELVGGKTA